MNIDVNQCNFTGRTTKDLEMGVTGNGTHVINFRIACNDGYKNDSGTVDRVNWIPCVIFGKKAENMFKYVLKGRKIYISGKFESSEWNDSVTGEKQYGLKLNVQDIKYLGSNPGQGGTQTQTQGQTQTQTQVQSQQYAQQKAKTVVPLKQPVVAGTTVSSQPAPAQKAVAGSDVAINPAFIADEKDDDIPF